MYYVQDDVNPIILYIEFRFLNNLKLKNFEFPKNDRLIMR